MEGDPGLSVFAVIRYTCTYTVCMELIFSSLCLLGRGLAIYYRSYAYIICLFAANVDEHSESTEAYIIMGLLHDCRST